MRTNFHKENFALRLALKSRQTHFLLVCFVQACRICARLRRSPFLACLLRVTVLHVRLPARGALVLLKYLSWLTTVFQRKKIKILKSVKSKQQDGFSEVLVTPIDIKCNFTYGQNSSSVPLTSELMSSFLFIGPPLLTLKS